MIEIEYKTFRALNVMIDNINSLLSMKNFHKTFVVQWQGQLIETSKKFLDVVPYKHLALMTV